MCAREKPPVRLFVRSSTSSHDGALGVALLGLAGLLTLFNLGNHALESLVDVLVELCADLDPPTAQLIRQLLAFSEGDLALFGAEVGLVADEHDGDGVSSLDHISAIAPQKKG